MFAESLPRLDDDRDEQSKVRLSEAKALLSRELTLQCEYWQQKSAIKWLQAGDANTKYFHVVVKQRKSSDFITRIKERDSQWIHDLDQIKSSAAAFFSTLFTSKREGRAKPQLFFDLLQDAVANEEFHKFPLLEEVRVVVFSISCKSAPGPDGFGAGFYQGAWVAISSDLLEVVHDFFRSVQQPKGFTSTLIILIPKGLGACCWREFRPISLCNFSSKIISKVLANRINELR